MGSARLKSKEAATAAVAEAEKSGQGLDEARTMLELSIYYEAARDLAGRLTQWSKNLGSEDRRFVVCTGGGPGIMEAANRGASEAKGLNVGLTISLPNEEFDNPFVSRELHMHFHYFFMRKFWFAYLAKALVIFPGGFGTLDELFEILTLVQTDKLSKKIEVVLYGSDYWTHVLDLKPMAEWGAIAEKDLDLMSYADTPSDAFELLKAHLVTHHLEPPIPQETVAPGIAKTRG